ncbi:sphingomyelin phosphodiesterase [Penaeus vannamei]|uniref:sphingomyelin phosphodiesterase n=1 Tax=Penaeus vannamei TaxID=6689 RepID=UPI00387F5B37
MGWAVGVIVGCVLLGLAGGAPPPAESPSLQRLHNPASGPEDTYPSPGNGKVNLACVECELAVDVLQGELNAGVSYEAMVAEAILVCSGMAGLTETYCKGYIPLVAPIVYHVFTHKNVTARDFCGMLMASKGCTSDNPEREWSVDIHGEKPPVEPIILPEPDAPKLKVLHLSDTHLDPLYTPGSNAACPEQLCCREESGLAETEEDRAWYWGDYRNCGSPAWMLEDMLAHARNTHTDLDYVMWTGDVVPHNMWSTSREWNLRLVRETNALVRKWFPDVPVFPVVGNHEMSPLDQYSNPGDAPEELSADWLYEELAAQWAHLIPSFNDSTVLHAGYYSVLIKPGFRVISFNSMFGYGSNIWLVQTSNDPAGELAWLEDQLAKAEAAGELVHLLGHIPPGIIDVHRAWSREYNRIVVRYENVIRGQFFGHTHFDEFQVFHDGERPVGVAYVAPSQTPWYDLNPAYRVYHVDGDRPDTTRLVLDHETYFLNLTAAEASGEAHWERLYSARDAYGMAALTPADWQDLAERMAADRSLFDVYYKHYVSAGDPYMALGCDDLCYQQRLCDVVTSNRNDLDSCYEVLRKSQQARDRKD